MPTIEVDHDVYDHVARCAKLWGQTMGDAVATLIRLRVQPQHTVARSLGPTHDEAGQNGANAGEVCR